MNNGLYPNFNPVGAILNLKRLVKLHLHLVLVHGTRQLVLSLFT